MLLFFFVEALSAGCRRRVIIKKRGIDRGFFYFILFICWHWHFREYGVEHGRTVLSGYDAAAGTELLVFCGD